MTTIFSLTRSETWVTSGKDQDFPHSIEVQLLGGRETGTRTTANLCTPGTDVVYRGSLFTPHCLASSSATLDGDQWVRAELIVWGGGTITHLINGTVVLEYAQPQVSAGAGQGDAGTRLLKRGFIALQSESHPLDFRSVRVRVLD